MNGTDLLASHTAARHSPPVRSDTLLLARADWLTCSSGCCLTFAYIGRLASWLARRLVLLGCQNPEGAAVVRRCCARTQTKHSNMVDEGSWERAEEGAVCGSQAIFSAGLTAAA